jgi:uncharacterized protein with PIN domain
MATVAKIAITGNKKIYISKGVILMCPECNTELEPYTCIIYHDGMTIQLRFQRCMKCNTIHNVDAKFTLDAVH